MMKFWPGKAAVAVFLITAASAFAADEAPKSVPWEKQFTEDGITVYSREVPGSNIVALRGECDMEASLGKLATIMADTPRKPEWMHKLVESRLIRKISDNERIEYNHTAVPWPFQDREFVYHAKMTMEPAKNRMVLFVESVNDDAE
ncbi:MAG: START domain-containing protein, partial [Bdellovibrionota bacterium]